LAHFDVRDAATSCLKLRHERTRAEQDASSQFDPEQTSGERDCLDGDEHAGDIGTESDH
jgi:hypothetical protein